MRNSTFNLKDDPKELPTFTIIRIIKQRRKELQQAIVN